MRTFKAGKPGMADRPPLCRFCSAPLSHSFVDLGETPLANSYLTAEDAAAGLDKKYPLHARVCASCFLVQVDEAVPPQAIFSHYAYFSSYSDTWMEHAKRYAKTMQARLALDASSQVIEVASNDGYLLKHFIAMGVPVLGVEPAANVAAAALAAGIPTEVAFFGSETAQRLRASGIGADLMVANNVLAHVPRILDFTKGFELLLKPEGVATFEFPHVLNLIRDLQFDTIYHEHYSYLSFLTVQKIFAAAGLRVFDVEELSTHGGSLRVFACKAASRREATERLASLAQKERDLHLDGLSGYEGFAARVDEAEAAYRAFAASARRAGKRIAAYGAAAKGNTFLNVCGVTSRDIVCVFDRSKEKQGKVLPGSHIPIVAPDRLEQVRPDYLLILPWNLADEVMAETARIRGWGGRFVTAIPNVRIV